MCVAIAFNAFAVVVDVQCRVEWARGSLLVGMSGEDSLQLTVLVLSCSMEDAFEDGTSEWFLSISVIQTLGNCT